VVGAAYVNRFGHPRKEMIERLDYHTVETDPHMMRTATGSQPDYTFENVEDYREVIYSTVVSGNIIVTSRGSGYSITTQPHE
jgi:beta-lactamase superfamily II metal-dependent hydrolase